MTVALLFSLTESSGNLWGQDLENLCSPWHLPHLGLCRGEDESGSGVRALRRPEMGGGHLMCPQVRQPGVGWAQSYGLQPPSRPEGN